MSAIHLFLQEMKKSGYDIKAAGIQGVTLIYRYSNYIFRGILCVDMTANPNVEEAQFHHLCSKIEAEYSLSEQFELYKIVFSDKTEDAQICKSDSRAWFVDEKRNELVVYEHQPRNIFIARPILEDLLEKQRISANKKPVAYVNFTILAINVIVFFLMEFIGDRQSAGALLRWGAVYPPLCVEQGEYWRLLTQIFLHGDMEHLVNNMLLLALLGDNLERALGHWKYLCLYLISGVGASMVSLAVQVFSATNYITLGASGAVFGILGALLYLLLINKGRLEGLRLRRFLVMVGLSLYSGFTSTGIDNAAHVGGLVIGFGVACLFIHLKKIKLPMRERRESI